MPTAAGREPLEPLFAHNRRLWLRVWVATQAAALVVAGFAAVVNAGGLRPFLSAPSATRSLAIIALLIVYHAVGLRGHDWILRHA